MSKQEIRVKKAHIALMKHPETALYSGVMLMGKSEVVDDGCPTAYTDGVNKVYGRKFLETVDTEPKVRGLILHENLHVALKQLPRGKDMFEENRKLANIAADMVVNNIIEDIKGTVNGSTERIVALPDGAVYDPMFQNWSMREVYNYLKKNCKGGKWVTTKNPAELATEFRGDKVNVIDFRQTKLKHVYQWRTADSIFGGLKDVAKSLGETRDFIKFYFTGPKLAPHTIRFFFYDQ